MMVTALEDGLKDRDMVAVAMVARPEWVGRLDSTETPVRSETSEWEDTLVSVALASAPTDTLAVGCLAQTDIRRSLHTLPGAHHTR